MEDRLQRMMTGKDRGPEEARSLIEALFLPFCDNASMTAIRDAALRFLVREEDDAPDRRD